MEDRANALNALDQHWAVAAVDAATRERLVALAESRASREGANGHHALDPDDAGAVETLAGAYDLAARERLAELAGAAPGAASDDARAQVQSGAGRAFALYAALATPHARDPLLPYRMLHLRALAEVGGRRPDWARWRRLHAPALPNAGAREAPWDEYLLRQLTEVWLELLDRSGPSGVEPVMERLAALRELRQEREEALHRAHDGDATRLNFFLFALDHLCDAAAELTLYLRRGAPLDIGERLSLHFALARGASAGDVALGVVLTWLDAAAREVARRRSPQLDLPGVP
jgi:hypothetical protein